MLIESAPAPECTILLSAALVVEVRACLARRVAAGLPPLTIEEYLVELIRRGVRGTR